MFHIFHGFSIYFPLDFQDPPVLLLENVLDSSECAAFVESMRSEDGTFPERLGQANLDVPPGEWLGNGG